MFCSNCGKEINENAAFCGNCGAKIKEDKKQKFDFKFDKLNLNLNFDGKKILSSVGTYLSNFYVDYGSVWFRWAMVLFLAIGIGGPLYDLVVDIFNINIPYLFLGVDKVFRFCTSIILFVVFAIFLPRKKDKNTLRKSNFLRIFWIVSVALSVLIFIAGNNIRDYIIYSNIAKNIINLCFAFSTAFLLYKNNPKYPIAHFISALVFVLRFINISIVKLWINHAVEYSVITSVFRLNALGFVLLVVLAFLTMYLIPKKFGKWIVCLLSVLTVVNGVCNFIKTLELSVSILSVELLSLFESIVVIAILALWAISCTKENVYDYEITNLEKAKKSILTVGIISLVTVVVITVVYLITSAIICSKAINKGMAKWKHDIVNGNVRSISQWEELNNDIFDIRATKLSKQFIDDYYIYETLNDYRDDMKSISTCYLAFSGGSVTEELTEGLYNLDVDSYWAEDSILSPYYDMYLAMQPDIENVSVSSEIDINNGEIRVTVVNDNIMPISKCSASCKFTILFVEPGSYSDNEYGRGTKTILVENIPGKSEKTETISFDADQYYNSYGSYITAVVFEKSTSIDSIE